MSGYTFVRTVIRNLVRRRVVERELDEELEAYVELLAADMMRAGASPDEARRAARVKIGGLEQTKDRVRDARPANTIESLLRDFQHGIRLARRSPGFASVAILTIAVGIGATSAIFTVVNAVALKPLPYPRSERLVYITSQIQRGGLDKFSIAVPEYLELRERARSYTDIAAYRAGAVNVSEGRPERVGSIAATPNMFDVLGVHPRLGRKFTAAEAMPGTAPVVILSDGLWRRAFGGDASILQKQIEIQGRRRTVVGVMPAGFDLHDTHTDVWLPLAFSPAEQQNRGSHSLFLIARLKEGVAPRQASSEMTSLLRQWSALNPGVHTPNPTTHPLQIAGLQEEVIGNVGRALWILQGAVLLVWLIACANVANLLLVRADARRREFAIRATLGAGRGRILTQNVAEGLVLTIVGAALGLVLARTGLAALLAINPDGLPRAREIAIDPRVVALTVSMSMITAVIFGLAPLLHLGRQTVAAAIKDGGSRSTVGSARSRMRHTLIVSEIALALVLVVGAGLLVRSFQRLTAVDAGFDPRHLITFGVNLPAATYQDAAHRSRMAEQLSETLRSIGGVEAAAPVTGLPPNRLVNPNLTDLEHVSPPTGMPGHTVDYNNFAGIDYFATMGIPIVRGRGFVGGDAQGPPVVVINEAMARRFYATTNPIGRRVRPTSPPLPPGTPDTLPWFTIVGVAKNVKQGGLDQSTGTEIYYNIEQGPRVNGVAQSSFNVVLRSPLSVAALEAPIELAVRGIDRALPVIQLRSMEAVFGASLARQRLLSMLLGAFAIVALTLAAVGTYGVLSYTVTERRKEIGVRVALGASTHDIVRLVVGQAFRSTGVGVIIGLIGAFALARAVRTLLFGISPTDATTYVTVAAGLLLVALIASLIPARRALRIDPLEAIRSD